MEMDKILKCHPSCKCKSGKRAVDELGNCHYWCSQYGYCGETEAHKENGVDCRYCAGIEILNAWS